MVTEQTTSNYNNVQLFDSFLDEFWLFLCSISIRVFNMNFTSPPYLINSVCLWVIGINTLKKRREEFEKWHSTCPKFILLWCFSWIHFANQFWQYFRELLLFCSPIMMRESRYNNSMNLYIPYSINTRCPNLKLWCLSRYDYNFMKVLKDWTHVSMVFTLVCSWAMV